jgi:predicted methyltransferase
MNCRTAKRVFILVALALGPIGVVGGFGQDTIPQEADRLASLLKWHAGSVVAEIGAGDGKLTLAAAQHVGASGKVYTTELDPAKLTHLQELAASHKNVAAVKAAETQTNLPPRCCDSIFMRLVYHHFTKPEQMDASLLQSLKPGGLLAVVDEEPSPGSTVPEGVPNNRGGHGIPPKILIHELTSAGFKLEKVHNDWPHDQYHQMYCVVFRKPQSQ